MRTFLGSIFALLAATSITCSASAAQPQDVEAQLKRVNAKYTKDAEGRIVAVELPGGSRDFHLEALFDTPTITEVKAPRCRASFETVKQMVKHLPALSAVYFEGVENANDYVACLREAKNLKTLSVAGSTLTNHGLNDICVNHPDLRGLDVSRTKIDGLGIAPLANLNHLESLGLLGVRDARVDPFGELDKERHNFQRVASLPSLKRLAVSGINIIKKNEDLEPLTRNSHLEEVLFEGTDLQLYEDYLREQNPKLFVGQVSLFYGYYLERMNQTKAISGTHAQLTKFPPSQLGGVERVEINNPPDFSFLDRLPRIKDLSLDETKLDLMELKRLRTARTIKRLSFRRTKIDQPTAAFLLSLDWLERLTFFASCEIDAPAEMVLLNHPTNVKVVIEK